MKSIKIQGINFKTLNLTLVRPFLLSDASFANTKELKSKSGYLILMIDDDGSGTFVHEG